jgi:hypothetical protein
MQHQAFDRLARALAQPRSRRRELVALGGALLGATAIPLSMRAQTVASDEVTVEAAFPKDCRKFQISAGPSRGDKFKHIDDDLFIELIPKGHNRRRETLLNDDNGSPNGPNGDHIKGPEFKARVGDRIHVVARNAQEGGCELDEIWLHCIENPGGKIRLFNRISPRDCRKDADKIGVFFDETKRIRAH